jgi:hypothetical protein
MEVGFYHLFWGMMVEGLTTLTGWTGELTEGILLPLLGRYQQAE